MAALDYLHRAGLAVELDGERLRVTPVERITAEYRQYLRDHRAELLAELAAANDPPPEAFTWLAAVAHLLECLPDDLLEWGFIDLHDLAEQHRTHPRFAARLIRTHPAWSEQPAERR